MKRKVLILSASPRRGGNSDLLCDEFARGAREAGGDAEKVFLRGRKIGFCTGCGACYETGKCVQKDDMAEILQKMVDADALALATPVYFYTMDAQLKTLIDRCVARYREMKDKDIYIIATAADPDLASLDRTVDGIRGFTEDCLPDAREKGVLCVGGVWAAGDIRGRAEMQTAYEMGREAGGMK